MSRIYTRAGDAGQTHLHAGQCVPKHCLRVEACGSVDELQAALGLAFSRCERAEMSHDIRDVEVRLADVMAELASPGSPARLGEADVEAIERTIDSYASRLAEGFKWDVPGRSELSATLHVARTVARRAERRICELHADEPVDSRLLQYVNRISDLCYVMARCADEAA